RRAERRRSRPLLRAHPPPRLASRALLVVVHDADAPVPRYRPDRRKASGRGARLSASLGNGPEDDRRKLRRAAARLRRSLAVPSRARRSSARRPYVAKSSLAGLTAPLAIPLGERFALLDEPHEKRRRLPVHRPELLPVLAHPGEQLR